MKTNLLHTLRKHLLRTLLVVSVPFVASAQNVFVTSVPNFESCGMLSCPLGADLVVPANTGNLVNFQYILNAKLAMQNTDSGNQYARCNLWASVPLWAPTPAGFVVVSGTVKSVLVDRTDVRIPGGDNPGIQQAVALQGVYAPPPAAGTYSIDFEVECSAHNGQAQELVFTAIQLPVGSRVILGPGGYQGPPNN